MDCKIGTIGLAPRTRVANQTTRDSIPLNARCKPFVEAFDGFFFSHDDDTRRTIQSPSPARRGGASFGVSYCCGGERAYARKHLAGSRTWGGSCNAWHPSGFAPCHQIGRGRSVHWKLQLSVSHSLYGELQPPRGNQPPAAASSSPCRHDSSDVCREHHERRAIGGLSAGTCSSPPRELCRLGAFLRLLADNRPRGGELFLTGMCHDGKIGELSSGQSVMRLKARCRGWELLWRNSLTGTHAMRPQPRHLSFIRHDNSSSTAGLCGSRLTGAWRACGSAMSGVVLKLKGINKRGILANELMAPPLGVGDVGLQGDWQCQKAASVPDRLNVMRTQNRSFRVFLKGAVSKLAGHNAARTVPATVAHAICRQRVRDACRYRHRLS